MAEIALYLVIGVLVAVGVWQLAVWMVEIRDKKRKYRAAVSSAEQAAKPLLVVGGPWGSKPIRHWFNWPAHGSGDVCLDIDRRAIKGHPFGVVADATRIPFADGSFGAAFASHLLEHLPTAGDAGRVLEELNRVAGSVFLVYPSRQSIVAWIMPAHRLWVWQKGDRTYLKQRGGSGAKEVYYC